MFDETVTILENKKINAEYYKLVFSSKRLSQNVEAGQFLNIQIEDHQNLFLRRPFSYYRVRGSKIEILYEILGRGTALLAERRQGHRLKALGPLGKPFTQHARGKKHVLVAGGVGVPPLVFLAEALSSGLLRHPWERRLAMTPLAGLRKVRLSLRGAKEIPRPSLRAKRSNLRARDRLRNLEMNQFVQAREGDSFVLLIGCRSKGEVLPKGELAKVKGEVLYATDDGSYGKKGFVTVLLHELLKKENPKSLFIQTCGPRMMMSAVMKMAKEFGVEGEASIDERMACGVGACLGCVVETVDGFKTSCVEGPVFSFSENMSF